MKILWMKNQCLQNEGVDYSSHCMNAFVWDFEGSKGFAKFSIEFLPLKPSKSHTNVTKSYHSDITFDEKKFTYMESYHSGIKMPYDTK